ncbi:hypothetical protein LTR66_010962 [Elasticomyces elasticus]|nr:hypothetical protein LTR66_010962 [Elasticomyces elasticus]
MSINWVMLDPSSPTAFTPLPHESTLYTSPPRTSLSLASLNKFPGKEPFAVTSSTGRVFLTNRRVIYIPAAPTTTQPGAQTQSFNSFAAPILNLHDTHVTTPFFGPNAWTALVQPVAGGNIPPQHAALKISLTFKDGGAYDFHTTYERVKERLQQAVDVARESGHIPESARGSSSLPGVNMDSVHLEDLPAYEETGASVPQPQPNAAAVGNPAHHTRPQDQQRLESEAASAAERREQDTFSPPAEPPPGYEEAQMSSVAAEVERRLSG